MFVLCCRCPSLSPCERRDTDELIVLHVHELSEAVSRRFREAHGQELHVRGLRDELRAVAIIRHRIAVVVDEVDVVYRPLLDDESRRLDII